MDKAELLAQLISCRRDFHKYPESGWKEFRTTAKIAEALEKLGYQLRFADSFIREKAVMGRAVDPEKEKRRAAEQGAPAEQLEKIGRYTGLCAELDTGRPGPLSAIRFDIDAVEVQEAREKKHRPFRDGFASVNDGVMHACGHDGHTAVGIALASLLAEKKEKLRGRIRLIFQPAEEGVRGGYAFVDAGLADAVDCFVAFHLGLGLPTGNVFCSAEGFLCTTKFDAAFEGVGAHAGGEPERGKNALLAAASAALNLHAIAPHSEGRTRLNVGWLQAGEGRNVIPPSALMKLETRGETAKTEDYLYQRAMEVITGAALMYGVHASVRKMGEAPGAVCSPKLAELVKEAASEMEGVDRISLCRKFGGSDDACWYIKRVTERGGLATYIGIASDNSAGHHNRSFDIDESSMLIATELLSRLMLKTNGVTRGC